MIIGEITFPNKRPNLVHNLLKIVNIFGLIIVIIKNIEDKAVDQIRIFSPDFNGIRPIIKNTKKK